MNFNNGNRWTLAAFAATLIISGSAFAQQAAVSDPYTGVSQPPPDQTIVTSHDGNPDASVTPAPKPSPSTPAAAPSYGYTPASTPAHSNADLGIVSSVPAGAAPAPNHEVALQPHPGTDYDIVSAIPSTGNQLAEGSIIRVRLTERLSTKETNVGAPFKGEVTADVSKDGHVIIPAGSEFKGRVVGVRQGHHFGSSATLRLRPDLVVLPDGTAYHLYAQVAGSEAKGTRTDSEGGIQPKSQTLKNVAEYGVGAGAGAIVGAEFGGPPGALVGSLVGAGIITTHLLLQHPQVAEVPKGSTLVFSLTEPMELTPTRN